MKLSSFFAALATISILTLPAFAQDAVPPNPQVETQATQALLNAEIKLQKSIPLNKQGKRDYGLYSQNFNDIAIAFARLGRTQSALKATQFMTSNSAAETRSEVFRLSVRRSAILGDVKHAASLIGQIKNNNAKADALLTVARAYLRQNNYPAAQKVLFQVTPLVPKRFGALLYTASLFAQSGNITVAKRLFDRARGMIVPIPDATASDNQEVHGAFNTAFSQIRAFSISTLNAGFVTEWQDLVKSAPKLPRGVDADVLDALLRHNEIDLAIDQVRQSSPENKIAGLCIIAYYIAPEYPERAVSLLNEASDVRLSASTIFPMPNKPHTISEVKQGLDIFLALGYNKLRKENETQKWLQQLKEDTPQNKQALTQLQYNIYHLSISDSLNGKGTFPPDQLLQINDSVQSLLPELRHDKEAASLLLNLIDAQIAADQITQASDNIAFLEKDAKDKIVSAKNASDFIDALNVAELWKTIGDEQRCYEILQAIFNAPQKILYASKTERVQTFINFGFVDEGLRFFHTLSVEGKKPPQFVLSGLSYALAIAHPNQFPYELLKAQQPSAEATNISEFVRGLTNDLFQTPSERKFVLHSNGGGAGIIVP